MIKPVKIYVDVYGYSVYFANGTKWKDLIKWMFENLNIKSEQMLFSDLCVYSFFDSDFSEKLYDTAVLYSSKRLNFKKKDVHLLSHEITHIKNLIFQRRGIHSESGNDEHEAALNEFLMISLLKVLP